LARDVERIVIERGINHLLGRFPSEVAHVGGNVERAVGPACTCHPLDADGNHAELVVAARRKLRRDPALECISLCLRVFVVV
jgi:hypothetical protein